jgi:hypothetical protein
VPTKKISKKAQPPKSVQLIRAEIGKLMAQDDPNQPGKIGDAIGVYAYFDYDMEPIYVGQTSSSFRDRVSRHLTGQRSDAVAKFILDPFEVAFVQLWSVSGVADAPSQKKPGEVAGAAEKKKLLDPFEYTVYKQLEAASKFHAVLNEGVIHPTELVDPLPEPVGDKIIPDELWEERKHADVRIARRASTISRLSQMISEREVSGGMRRTLLLQAQRLEWLARERMIAVGADIPSAEDEIIGDE